MGHYDGLNSQRAEQDWSRARRRVLYQDVVCFFKECSVNLTPFEEVRSNLELDRQIDRGLQEIPLERIRGSVGRHNDFTSAFLPRNPHLQERWQRVAAGMRAGKTPPIDVYQVADAYYMVDGNHRVSVANQIGAETIPAYVTEYAAPKALGPGADLDQQLIRSEQEQFLEKIGSESPPAVREITFTTPACFRDLSNMVDAYRQGLAEAEGEPVSVERAVAGWYKDVYRPAVEQIQENDLLAQFSERTEADLFIWAWRNEKALDKLALEDQDPLPDN